MLTTEKIVLVVSQLPESVQQQVLDYVEYLLAKVEKESGGAEESDWKYLSIKNALRGMEEESTPVYSVADIKAEYK